MHTFSLIWEEVEVEVGMALEGWMGGFFDKGKEGRGERGREGKGREGRVMIVMNVLSYRLGGCDM